MKKNDYNTGNTPLKNYTNEEIKELIDSYGYFEGMRYIEEPEIQTIGKNKFDGEMVNKSINENTGEEEFYHYQGSVLNFTRWHRFKMWLFGEKTVGVKTSHGITTKTYSNLYKGILFIYKTEVTEEKK